jgi:hypothetical protein
MHARWIAELLAQRDGHPIDDERMRRRGGVVIEIRPCHLQTL